MNDLIKDFNVGNVSGLILAITSVIGLFIYHRQARAAERGLNLKITEVQELAHRIDLESKQRDKLSILHKKEVTERVENIVNLWEHINSVHESDKIRDRANRARNYLHIVDSSYIVCYLTILIRDVCIVLDRIQGKEFKDFQNSTTNIDIANIGEYFSSYFIMINIDKRRHEKYDIADNHLAVKKAKYNLNEMSADEMKVVYQILNSEHLEELNKVNEEYSKELEIATPKYLKSRENIASIISRISDKIIEEVKSTG